MANPYANPYMNPYLNPYMTQTKMGRTDALLYFYSAQTANGGLLSGQPNSARTASARPVSGASNRRQSAEMPTSVSVPGSGAGRYFQRGAATAAGRAPYFQRHNRYFANNGR